MQKPFEDRYWTSADGLSLHYRDYPGRTDRPPLLCLHGLTRNARDFANLAERFAGDWRIIVPEMRGRGESEYARDSSTYLAPVYVEDVQLLLAELGITSFVAIGTSMGGLMTMMLAAHNASSVAGALLNDIGPDVDSVGLDRIRSYLGHARNFPTWMHAARALEETHKSAHPGFDVQDWLAMAKRSMVLGQNGRISFDYDMAIADAFSDRGAPSDGAAPDEGAVAEPPDLWQYFETLQDRPLALIRGEVSEILSVKTAAEMKRRVPELEVVNIPATGHAPTLDEPESVATLERLLSKIQ